MTAEANRAAVKIVADKFDPPRPVVGTQQLNERPVQDAFTCSFYDESKGIGVTVVALGNGRFRAWLEIDGGLGIAERAGDAITRMIREY